MILQKTIKVGNLTRTIDVYTSPDQGCVAVKYSNVCKSFTDIVKLNDYLTDIVAEITAELNTIENRNAELNAYLKGFGFFSISNNVVVS